MDSVNKDWIREDENIGEGEGEGEGASSPSPLFPTVHIISDSLGETARAVAAAAAAQFGVLSPKIEVLAKVKTFEEVRDHLIEHAKYHIEQLGDSRLLVFYTLVHGPLRDSVSAFIDSQENIVGVDLLTGAIDAMARMSGLAPRDVPGAIRTTDIHYFRRVEALEFTINHDDGRNPQELTQADIVILGVSRTSKTPLSIYLAQQGYKVANVPLDLQTSPPREVYDVDPTRLFGLMTTPDVLHDIRARRIKGAEAAAGRYADAEYIYEDLESARALMRSLGCYILRTDRRAVEEVAQELLAYYHINHPI